MSRWTEYPSPSSSRPRPSTWPATVAAVLDRDGHVCQIREPGCTGEATTVDHIVPVAEGGSDAADNLRGACPGCNDRKRRREAAVGQRARAARARHPVERHPGIV